MADMNVHPRLNRTFMELKFGTEGDKYGQPLVLIEPLWN